MGRPWALRRRCTRRRALLVAPAACLLTAVLTLAQTGAARADTPTESGQAPALSSSSATDAQTPVAPPSGTGAATSTPVTTTITSPAGTTTTTTTTPSARPAAAAATNGATSPAPSSSSTGVSVVTGGQPSIPTTIQMPNSSRFRQAVSAFLSAALGAAPTSIRSMIGQSALLDVSGSSSATRCRCSVAVAVSAGGTATATAVSGAGPAALGSSAVRAATSATGNAGQDVPAAETSGSTGNAMSVSITGHGAATANASTGDSGIPAGPGTAAGSVLTAHNVAISYPLAAGAAINLDFALLLDGGTASSTFNVLPCGLQVCGGRASTATADIAVYAPNGSSCASVGTEWCTVAVAISVGGPAGSAHASVIRPAGIAGGTCAVVGRPTAVAIGVGGPAQATAHMGAGGGACPAGASPAGSQTGPVTAQSGNTGNALAVGVTAVGPAGSAATSGNAGSVRAITDSTGPTGTASSAIATTGDTGDAVGISIGKLSASSLVRSGSSGRAAALCTHCDLPGGDAIADSYTGRTGGSYALAIAGKQSTANAVSGDSGDAASWAVHGTAAIFQTGQNSTASPDNVVQTGNPGQVYVSGRSGDTGNVVATATDLLTWVSVLTQSGNAGSVISTAKWDADGCSLIFATFTITCTPPTAGQSSTEPVVPSGSQNAAQPVVSPAQGKIAVARGSAATVAPTSTPRTTASSTPTAGLAPAVRASTGGTTGGGGNRTSGHDVKVVGGARTRLASDNSIRSVVSPAASGSLTTWWAVLTLCVLAGFLLALTYVACRHGRPPRMNTG